MEFTDPGLDEALDLLRAGDYLRGFALYEQRITLARLPPRVAERPEWRGEPLHGKAIVVWGEQGRGDEIQMIRFVHDLRRLGARAVYLACIPNQMRLFSALGFNAVVGRFGAVQLPRFDYWVSAMSLPYRLQVTLETLRGAPYIPAPAALRTGKVGLVWHGNPQNPRDAVRSLPNPEMLQQAFPDGVMLDPGDGDMLDSAAQLAGLSALVTVDTSWTHLAGAIGLRTYLLIDVLPDWRWGASGERTPWYDSVRICRQAKAGDWSVPIRQAQEGLARYLA